MSDNDGNRYQMLWDCGACGSAGLLALNHKFCPGCGSPQDPKLRYFPSDEQKVAVEDHPLVGADLQCGACETPNAANVGFCVACGSPMDEAKAVARRSDVVVGEGKSFEGERGADARQDHKEQRQEKENARRREMAGLPPESTPESGGTAKKAGMGIVGLGCVGLIAVGIVAIGLFCFLNSFWSSEAKVSVVAQQWERTIQIETFKPVSKKAWKEDVPRTARKIKCREEQRKTRKVEDGETCKTRKKDNGDGTFSEKQECKPKYREEPVMGEKCSFVQDEWTVTDRKKTEGAGTEPQWPVSGLSGAKNECPGCQREGNTNEKYILKLEKTDDKSRHECEVPFKKYASFSVGDQVEARFGGLTGSLDCSSL